MKKPDINQENIKNLSQKQKKIPDLSISKKNTKATKSKNYWKIAKHCQT